MGAVLPLGLGVLLVAISFWDYLLFHTLAEGFAIVVALLMWVVAWNTHAFSRNHFLTYLANGFFWIALLDVVHAMTYEGMAILPITDANPATQLWLAARYSEALVLLTAPYFLDRPVRRRTSFVLFGAVAVGLCALIAIGTFPTAFVEGRGLTPFKIGSEYVIIALLVGAITYLARRRALLDIRVFLLVVVALIFTIGSELAFTFYVDVYGLSNLVGHIFKLFAFWLIYIGVVRTTLTEPFAISARGASTYDAVPNPAIVVDEAGIIRNVNRAAIQKAGIPEKDLLNRPCHDFFHPRETKPEDCDICRHVRMGAPMEPTPVHFAETDSWEEISLSPIDTPWARKGVVQLSRDITARWRTQAALSHSMRALRVISAGNQALVRAKSEAELLDRMCRIIVEQGGYVLAWVGYAEHDEAKTVRPVAHFGRDDGYLNDAQISWADSERGRGPTGTAIRTGEIRTFKSMADDPGFGPWRQAAQNLGYRSSSAFPLKNGDQTFGALNIYSDRDDAFHGEEMEILTEAANDLAYGITALRNQEERSRVEETLRENERRLRQSEKLEALGGLAGGIAHDFNNMLLPIQTLSAMTLKNLPDDDAKNRERLTRVCEAAQRAGNLVQRILAYSRSEEEQARESIDFAHVVGDAVSLLRSTLPATTTVVDRIEASVGSVIADAGQIQSVVLNLGKNAADAMAGTIGHLDIGVRKVTTADPLTDTLPPLDAGTYVRLTVADDGPGMPPEVVARIFEPFFTTKKVGEGTGLGLAMVHGIVTKAGGGIAVDSAPGRGTRFTLYFPAAADQPETGGSPADEDSRATV